MKTPSQLLRQGAEALKKEYKTAFFSALCMGLIIHMPALLSDIPNHDGLGSLYFDQNMITSGRWFLTVACGFSSYYSLPWVIGLLGLLFLSCTAVALTELLELKDTVVIVLVSGLLVSFPALASTFAYVFTLDGYMLAMFLAVLAVLCTKKSRRGFLAGAFCLAFSMGIYQAYLPFAILLCLYETLILFAGEGKWKEKLAAALRYLGMGILGAVLYYVILRILLLLQGKELAAYQGISGMGDGAGAAGFGSIVRIYRDFMGFTLRGNVVVNNFFSGAACVMLASVTLFTALRLCLARKWWKKPGFFAIIILLVIVLPAAVNVVLLISPGVTYHLLMRYQWALCLILMLAFSDRFAGETETDARVRWGMALAAAVLIFNYALTDNIGYANLQKRYEKTYAYCVRLLDRIERTEGYYQGIPVAMVGVVGEDPYPPTDFTGDVTSNMIGLNGDFLLYTGENYQAFIQNYLGATLNILPAEAMETIYYSEEYVGMESFPAEGSTKVIDGILYVKTENKRR